MKIVTKSDWKTSEMPDVLPVILSVTKWSEESHLYFYPKRFLPTVGMTDTKKSR